MTVKSSRGVSIRPVLVATGPSGRSRRESAGAISANHYLGSFGESLLRPLEFDPPSVPSSCLRRTRRAYSTHDLHDEEGCALDSIRNPRATSDPELPIVRLDNAGLICTLAASARPTATPRRRADPGLSALRYRSVSPVLSGRLQQPESLEARGTPREQWAFAVLGNPRSARTAAQLRHPIADLGPLPSQEPPS